MTDPSVYINFPRDILEPCLENLADLFLRMETAYAEVAARYGFQCAGCEDNCCLTRFYHHTLLEYLYLYRGYSKLSEKERVRLRQRAVRVNREIEQADTLGEQVRVMCPLNEKGLCGRYQYRPMICRLHGIPNEMKRPGGVPVRGPGCGDFDRQCGPRQYIPFDRTPFYMEMAVNEKEIRGKLGFTEKIKMTVARMIVNFRT
jgi:Fe-S-cluster containining protein